ncbi:MAG: primosomal protein N' [Desulfuromonadales bacterium]|nr:primosomal protein N' [Desulfuromonadales bacterium]
MPDLVADIAVTAPLKKIFSYLVPEEMASAARTGLRVRVPFGRRRTVGFLLALREGESDGLKPISEILDKEPLFNADLLRFIRWGADYYDYPLGQAIRTALPGGLSGEQQRVTILSETSYRALPCEQRPRGNKQQQLYDFIRQHEDVPLSLLRETFSAPHAALARLVELGFLAEHEQEKKRDPFFCQALPADTDLALNDEQRVALSRVEDAVAADAFHSFLLHGVTGSGKTEVYLRAIEKVVSFGRQGLVLVPEIALTPQLVARFRARFEPAGRRIAVLHSGLSDGERYDAWRAIARGEIDIVIGARSAIFAPLDRPGLIIVDEEHESSYKQGEGFRYSARDLALVRGQQAGCPVLLGSATPSLGSYHRAEQGLMTCLSLTRRVHSGALPAVELVDLAEYRTETSLAAPLIEAIQQTLERQEQVLLLLNRRGFAPFLLCTDCGTSFRCPNCEITLTFHQGEGRLRCHYCDYTEPPVTLCPKCEGANIEPQGAGTERLEQELEELFPGTRIARMDRDTTTRKGAHQRLVEQMMQRKIDILVGTQMIAKGHDFPGVALVGVLGTDSILNLPDFRSAERAFSLLTQVAGRAGRAGGGRVLIQTFSPDHYALECAARQDFKDFYAIELPLRRELGYPPCGFLVNLVLSGNEPGRVLAAAGRLAAHLEQHTRDVEILGPSPCPLARLRGKTRCQILLKAGQRSSIRQALSALGDVQKLTTSYVSLTVDVDPLDMF